jgi:hypothetical protein
VDRHMDSHMENRSLDRAEIQFYRCHIVIALEEYKRRPIFVLFQESRLDLKSLVNIVLL